MAQQLTTKIAPAMVLTFNVWDPCSSKLLCLYPASIHATLMYPKVIFYQLYLSVPNTSLKIEPLFPQIGAPLI